MTGLTAKVRGLAVNDSYLSTGRSTRTPPTKRTEGYSGSGWWAVWRAQRSSPIRGRRPRGIALDSDLHLLG